MSDFAKNLKRLRKEKNWTQTKVGKLLNYGYSAIANYETGRNEPSFDDLLKLSVIFDVTTDELLGAEPRKKDEEFLYSFRKLSPEKQKIILELIESLQALP
ncbi:MAG: helix-turn-helix transcriptional regulator [Anaerotignum sp.]|nr:helix-turn-helix transcriptional regulator [Anaerotignum sp.]